MSRKIIIKTTINYNILWKLCIINSHKYGKNFINSIEYILNEFGTKMPCNRFDVGNCIEFFIVDYLKKCKLKVEHTPNATRNDIIIENQLYISIKYSSTGNITIHNSNSQINTDIKCSIILLLTPAKLYLLIPNLITKKYKINFNEYLINAGDSLKLKRTILTKLDQNNYEYIINVNIQINKEKCKNRLCSELFYKIVKYEIKNLVKK